MQQQRQQQRQQQSFIRYFCPSCNALLKECEVPIDDLLKTIVEDCPSCGSSLNKNIRKEEADHAQAHERPRFHTAYDFAAKLTFDIPQIDDILLPLSLGDRLCIVGGDNRRANNHHYHLLLTRLWIRALMPQRHGGLDTSSVVAIDCGNCTDVYQYVKFARQYYMDVGQALRSVRVSRAFTIYQVAGLIIHALPKAIERFNPKVVTISDLLDMFIISEPQLDRDEAQYLIKEIMDAISKKIPDDILVAVSLHNGKPTEFDNLILPAFNKRIELAQVNRVTKAKLYRNQKLVGEAKLWPDDLSLVLEAK